MSTNPPKLIAVPIERFIRYTIGDDKVDAEDCSPIHMDDAKIFSIVDPNEQYGHIQWPDKDNKLKQPLLWHIRRWRNHEIREAQMRASARRERELVDNFDENIATIARFFQFEKGLSKEASMELAETLQRNQSFEVLKHMGVTPEKLKEYEDTKKWSKRFRRL